jgi:TRAP-type C4-dicarboxylate transport system substrate-binding protein
VRKALLGLGVALALAGCTKPAPPGVVVLSYGTNYAPSHPFSRADKVWIDWIEKQSHGSIKIRPYWAGALLSADSSMEELRHGVADIGLITPIYVRGGEQLQRAQAGFYQGARTIAQQVALYRCLAADDPGYAKELQGLHVLAVQGGSLPGILTRDRPVTTLADLRGMRLRAPNELLPVLRQLGADPVNMPMSEVYSALAKGVIDGVVAPADTLKALHFAEVGHHFTEIAIPRGAYPARAIGDESWNRLTPAQRALLDQGRDVWETALDKEVSGAVDVGVAEGRKLHVAFHQIGAADQQRFDAIYNQQEAASARDLSHYGIDAMPAFRRARAITAGLAQTGRIDCTRGNDGSAA